MFIKSGFHGLIFSAWFLLLFPSTATSEDLFIGPDLISIPIPTGYCSLSTTNSSDNRVIKYLKDFNQNVNEVLLAFADCNQLKSWRVGQLPSLNDYGYVLVPSSYVNKKLNMSIDNFLSEMSDIHKQQGVQILDRSIRKLEAFMSENTAIMKLNETKNLGIISQDEKALYVGIIENIQTEEGENKNLVGINAQTLVDGKIVSLYLWKEYQGDRSIHNLEGMISAWVVESHLAN